MSKVARICEASKQRGNALVLLLLLKTWDGADAPDAYRLAELAHISPRQAERDLQKLIGDGEAERVPDTIKGRGHVTRYRLAGSTSDVSDKTGSDVTDLIAEEISASHPSGIEESTSDVRESTTHLTGLSDTKGVTSDGTPVAPSKAKNTSTEKELKPKPARKRATLEDFDLPDWLPPELITRWLDYRMELGHPVMRTSAAALVRELDGLRARGHPPEQVIERSIANGWRGLFELPERNGKVATHERFTGKQSPTRDLSIFPSADEGDGGDPESDHRPVARRDGLEQAQRAGAEHRHRNVV